MDSRDINYESYKEDRDIILEYNQVDLKKTGMVNLLGMGIDNVSCLEAVVKVKKMIEDGGLHHVIALNPYKFIRFRSNNDLNVIYNKATMKFVSGAGLQWAAKMVRTPVKDRIPFLHFMMELIRLAEIKDYTVFVVGGKPETAEKVFFNIKRSFPKIRVVGRHGGYFSADREKSVVEAIRKSEANIVFVGMGFPREERWIAKFKSQFKNAVFISCGGSFDIISGDNRKAPEYFMSRGLDWFFRIITRPWRIGRLCRVFFFFILVIFYRLFKIKSTGKSVNERTRSKKR
jgi:N-acetylglucosaminyldiphosphoundecaprenol N-acetyl-beta-D-mannosaminyltransferase